MAQVQREQREKVIQFVTNQMRCNAVSLEFKVTDKPRGMKIIYELTQEEMDMLVAAQTKEN